uniref:anthocyanidin 3-O-glucosyltransferase n=1 Tax=Salix viminalis TaxID=40686 RepID=A0A6N2L8V7_SALVM
MKLLHYKGFHITFVNTEFNHKRLLRSRGPDALDDLPGFHFRTIPDGLPPSDIDATQAIPSLCDAMNKNFLAPFTDLLLKLKNTVSEDNPPITCIVADPFAPVAIRAGEEVGLPVVMYATVNACAYMGFKQLYTLREKGFIPIKDLSDLGNGYLETKVDWAPGMKDVRLKDFPFIQTTDPDDVVFNFVMGAAETSIKARAIALHTFDALDQSIGYNLWKEDRACLQWLDTKEPKSVVYVNFGSITVMTAGQLVEFAMGLANSKISFLWIIRPDLVTGESAVLPAEFAETENRSFITSWCPQEEVLNHPAVGGFLTHSGWGSTIESLCAGVPMVCWPFFADQAMNCRYSCNEWGVGMEIDNNVKREEVKMLVKELMEGGEGEKMREKAMEWKREKERGMGSISKPHVVVIPCPLQGHIKTMLKFAKLLHYKGLHITFVNTEFNHKRLLRSGGLHAVDDLPGLHFETIPDGLPPSDIDATQAIPSLCDAMNKNFLAPFTDLLLKLKNTVSENNPPITCVVADPFAPFSIKAGEEVGLPVVMYATMNACGYMGFKHLYTLREKGFTPIKDLSNLSNGYLETKVDCAPGMKDVRLKDFPFIQTTDPDDVVFNFVIGVAETSVKARAIALHTFDALEPDVLDGLSTIFPRVYSIGPLQLLLNQIEENGLKSIGYNLWKEDRACLQWLDTKEPKSVVYVNFGSIAVMTADQLVEFAMGLANSNISFLWIIRPDLVTGESAVLPAEFAETENRSFITSWCPQEEVLNHPAVGG